MLVLVLPAAPLQLLVGALLVVPGPVVEAGALAPVLGPLAGLLLAPLLAPSLGPRLEEVVEEEAHCR